ncbi:ABC transporter substrate-binding protein [Chloroflexus sp.]|uniref:ABC transporter substrate-binding protein n=1 Tax=Chloroflexus sp. TaxID=1904827 RepID=UPI00298F085F|nr:ABC transporter substrate-binding protein [Chloroflexus sp.]MDW8403712.1 ABC transporter substrate-binding protein [Chloroflexus sp.]
MSRNFILPLLAIILVLAACAGSAPAGRPLQLVETTASYRLISHAFGETRAPLAPQRILALGEEGLLADLLDAGIRPVASNVNVPDNVPLLDAAELAGIALFPSAGDISLETLSAYQPDLIIGTRFFIEQIGYQRLSSIAPTIVLSGATPLDNYIETLTIFGRGEEAQQTVAAFRAEVQAVAGRLNAAERQVSMVTIYPGANIALWFDGPSPIPLLVRELGLQIRPDPATVNGLNIRNGRAFISLEQLTLVSGETMLLLQTSGVEGEAQAVVELQSNPLWQQLPAVQAQRVVTLDRIGYPGLRGQRALLADLQQALSP